jgi:hypothetical protein
LPKKILDSEILKHKLKAINSVVSHFKTHGMRLVSDDSADSVEISPLVVSDNQLGAKYPCLIILLNDNYTAHREMQEAAVKIGSQNEYENYCRYVTHLMIASINHELLKENIGVLVDRRQSFGFLTPTATDVHSAVRLSFGLMATEKWKHAVCKGIKNCNQLLHTLWQKKHIIKGTKRRKNIPPTMGTPHGEITTGLANLGAHKLFLGMLLNNSELAEFKNFATTQGEKSKDAASRAIKASDTKEEEKKSETDDPIENNPYAEIVNRELERTMFTHRLDPESNELYRKVMMIYDILNQEKDSRIRADDSSAHVKFDLLMNAMEKYQSTSMARFQKKTSMDVTSESEDRNSKSYSSSGMSALFAPLYALCSAKIELHNQENSGVDFIPLTYGVKKYGYFELDGWAHDKLNPKFITVCMEGEPNILFIDNNPCVNRADIPFSTLETLKRYTLPTEGKSEEKDPPLKSSIKPAVAGAHVDRVKESKQIPELIVIDTTSTTQEDLNMILAVWKKSQVPYLVFAESGLKNKQLGLDLVSYGETRLFSNDKYTNEKLTSAIKYHLRSFTVASSSPYATMVRRELRDAIALIAHEETLQHNLETIKHINKALNFLDRIAKNQPERFFEKGKKNVEKSKSFLSNTETYLHKIIAAMNNINIVNETTPHRTI